MLSVLGEGRLLQALRLGVARRGQSDFLFPNGRGTSPARTNRTQLSTVEEMPRGQSGPLLQGPPLLGLLLGQDVAPMLVAIWSLQGERLPEDGPAWRKGELGWRVSKTPEDTP